MTIIHNVILTTEFIINFANKPWNHENPLEGLFETVQYIWIRTLMVAIVNRYSSNLTQTYIASYKSLNDNSLAKIIHQYLSPYIL